MSPLDSVDGVTEAAAAPSSPQWVLRVEFKTAKLHHLHSTDFALVPFFRNRNSRFLFRNTVFTRARGENLSDKLL